MTRCIIDGAGLASGDIDRAVRQALQESGTLYVLDEALLRHLEPDVILTSPLVRARETADIIVAGLRGAPEPRMLDALGSDVAPEDTLKALRVFGRNQQVMVVGHEPNLSSVLALLLTGSSDGVSIELKKGSCAAVEVTVFEPRAGAMLRWLLPPRALRRARR